MAFEPRLLRVRRETMDASQVFLARQPIYDRHMELHGYELLYRSGNVDSAGTVGTDRSAATIVRAVSDIGLERLVEDLPAFVNIPGNLLNDPGLLLLPTDRVVLEILETAEPTKENLEAAKVLAERGYTLALDDFVFGSEQEAFLRYCKIVKIDLLGNDMRQLRGEVRILKSRNLTVLAEKVETPEMHSQCLAAGCDLFQGYFFAKPAVISANRIPDSGSLLVRLTGLLSDPSISLAEVEEAVCSDVGLTYRLLKLVNCASIGVSKPIESVRTALMVLGVERVKALVSLLTMAGKGSENTELLVTAMVRAKMCEGVATRLKFPNPSMHFTVGLFSVLDALFGMPMTELVVHLPLTDELKQALVSPDSSTNLGRSLELAQAFEKGSWSVCDQFSGEECSISESYLSAVSWAVDMKKALAA